MNLETVSATLVKALSGVEAALRKLNPLAIPQLSKELLVHLPPLEAARDALLADDRKDGQGRRELLPACQYIMDAIQKFGRGDQLQDAYRSVLRAARKHCQAQEALLPLCSTLPGINRYFLEPEAAGPDFMPAKESPDRKTGLFHSGSDQSPYPRGGYSFYIPETYSPDRPWPLVVALHGGYSHGRDFIWTWLREARSRGFVLLAPTSLGQTWSILDVAVDAQPLRRHIDDLCSRVNIDRNRILLTGMSDGGTFALAAGISRDCPYCAIASVSCALPPVEMRHAEGKRLFWLHGAQDWMFPVSRTVQACKALSQSGADIKLKIVDNLSHAYPREENDTILRWFDPVFSKPSESIFTSK